MTAKEECEQACLYLLSNCYEVKELGNDNYEFTPSGFKESEIFRDLIIDYFKLKKDKEVLEKALLLASKEISINLNCPVENVDEKYIHINDCEYKCFNINDMIDCWIGYLLRKAKEEIEK